MSVDTSPLSECNFNIFGKTRKAPVYILKIRGKISTGAINLVTQSVSSPGDLCQAFTVCMGVKPQRINARIMYPRKGLKAGYSGFITLL